MQSLEQNPEDHVGPWGDWNPLTDLAKTWTPQLLVVLPWTGDQQQQAKEFIDNGCGYYRTLIEQLDPQHQAQATTNLRTMLPQAVGFGYVVWEGFGGILVQNQLWFGGYAPQWVEAMVAAGPHQDPSAVTAIDNMVKDIVNKGPSDRVPRISGEPTPDRWLELAWVLAYGQVQGHGKELAEGVLRALGLGRVPCHDDLDAVGLCRLLAGDVDGCLDVLKDLAKDDPDTAQEAMLQVVKVVLSATNGPAHMASLLTPLLTGWSRVAEVIEESAPDYELRLAFLRLTIAGNADQIREAAQALLEADRKAARQDLSREPIWEVRVPVASEQAMTTREAADYLERSSEFVAKRLEKGLIPFVRQETSLRLPRPALDQWAEIFKKING